MQSITVNAKIIGTARNVKTKNGKMGVVDALLRDGTKKTIWKQPDDVSIFRLCNGERVTLTLDDQGKVLNIEGSYDRVQALRASQSVEMPPMLTTTQQPRAMGFDISLPMEAERQLGRQVQAMQQPVVEPVTKASIDQLLDQYSDTFRICLARAELLSPQHPEPLALELFRLVCGDR